MERRHYQRIRNKAIEAANAGVEPKPDRTKPLLIGGGVLLVGLLLWGFIERVIPDREPEDATEAAEVAADSDAEEVEFEGLLTSDVEALARKFLEADSVEALLEIVEQPEISEPRMRAFYADPDSRRLPMGGQMLAVAPLEYEGAPVYGMVVERLFGSRSLLPIMEGEDGKPSLRWEWAVGWAETEWEEVVKAKPQEPTAVKVFAQLDDYYNYEYRDASKWLCLRLAGRDMKTSCYAYADRSDPNIADFRDLGSTTPVCFTIKFAPGAKRNQAEVVKFHHVGWMGD